MYMPRKIPKYEYKPQGTDLCNPRKYISIKNKKINRFI